MSVVERLADLYIAVLTERMGLAAEARQDVVLFRPLGDLKVLVQLYESDPGYLQLIARYAPFNPPVDRAAMLGLCNGATGKTKGAKAVLQDDGSVNYTVEMLVAGPGCLPDPSHLTAVLPRAVSMLTSVIREVQTGVTLSRMEQDLDE